MELMLKQLRKSRTNYTQADMADLLGMKQRTYESWERGQAMPNLFQAHACAKVIGCTIDELAGRDTAHAVTIRGLEKLNEEGRNRVISEAEASAELYARLPEYRAVGAPCQGGAFSTAETA